MGKSPCSVVTVRTGLGARLSENYRAVTGLQIRDFARQMEPAPFSGNLIDADPKACQSDNRNIELAPFAQSLYYMYAASNNNATIP